MAVLSEQILAAAALRPEGSLLAAKQFLALGQRDAVDQATGAGAGDRPAQPRRCSAVGQQRRRCGQCPGPHHPDARGADLPGPQPEPEALRLRQAAGQHPSGRRLELPAIRSPRRPGDPRPDLARP